MPVLPCYPNKTHFVSDVLTVVLGGMCKVHTFFDALHPFSSDQMIRILSMKKVRLDYSSIWLQHLNFLKFWSAAILEFFILMLGRCWSVNHLYNKRKIV